MVTQDFSYSASLRTTAHIITELEHKEDEIMKYTTTSNDDNRMEYHITEGNAYIAFVTMGGAGFRVDEVKEGETWYEGVGEEVCIVADSEDAAYDYIRRVYG